MKIQPNKTEIKRVAQETEIEPLQPDMYLEKILQSKKIERNY